MAQLAALTDLETHLITNALSFLRRSIDTGATAPEQQHLAFAITDLAVAVEVLMKSRLAREHWTLILNNPDKATPAAVLAGSATTVTAEQAFGRLVGVAGLGWLSGHKAQVVDLARLRDRVVHSTAGTMRPQALAACWGAGLSFAVSFLDKEFRGQVDSMVEENVEQTLDVMRPRVAELRHMREVRMQSISTDLDQAGTVVECPLCRQPALMLREGEISACAFCSWYPVDADVVAGQYVDVVLGLSHYEVVRDGGEWVVHRCVECDEEAFVEGIRSYDRSESGNRDLPVWGCFGCGRVRRTDEVVTCVRCGVPADDTHEETMLCSACTDAAFALF